LVLIEYIGWQCIRSMKRRAWVLSHGGP
jgi:hypothetical protein